MSKSSPLLPQVKVTSFQHPHLDVNKFKIYQPVKSSFKFGVNWCE